MSNPQTLCNINDHLFLTKNPFSKKSSEQEKDFISKIFFEPNYYHTLKDDLSNGDSRFIIGQRGFGKSSIINKLYQDLSQNNILTILIDRYDEIPIKKNETALLKLILKQVTRKLCVFLYSDKKHKKKLTPVQLEKLALFIRMFFVTLSAKEHLEIYNNIHSVKSRNVCIKLMNRFGIKIFNTLATTAVNLTSSVINKSIGVDSMSVNNVYTEYFGELKEITSESININGDEFTKERLKDILDDLLEITEVVGFSKTVILFDKIDEYQELQQDVVKIGNFTTELLTDTELLLNNMISFGISLWSEVKTELSGSVRFDKFDAVDLSWQTEDLEKIIDKRLDYFSKNQKVLLNFLIKNQNDKSDILKLANKSPRDLISTLSSIYQEQANLNIKLDFFTSESISKGLINFCLNYDYDSQFSSKVGRKKEIKAMINKILSTKNKRFTVKILSDTLNQSNSQSEGQIKLMIKYRLIREEEIMMDSGSKSYEVIDPKIVFMLSRSISRINTD
jgi:hypothetical protein